MMRNGVRLLVALLTLSASGCALEQATVASARTAGKATVKVAKAGVELVTWPIREIRKHDAAPPAQVVAQEAAQPVHPDKPTVLASGGFDGDVRLVSGPDPIEDEPAPRPASKPKAKKTKPSPGSNLDEPSALFASNTKSEPDSTREPDGADEDLRPAKSKPTRSAAADDEPGTGLATSRNDNDAAPDDDTIVIK
jgi:hypothetical protein